LPNRTSFFNCPVYGGQVSADLIINGIVIIELKSVELLTAAHRKQLQTYLRLSDIKLGFLLNFGAALMRSGIVRAVNNLPD
jgi:GxxExxY protein